MSELSKQYRPKKFNDIYGHQAIKKSLIKQLLRPNPPHCYLFKGPPGVGKTTFARICARKLGCKGMLNLREHNSAENRGIDSVRTILANLQFKTITSGTSHNRAHIFDECHMLTPEAQTALLKDTEEPPDHIFFFFCTTDVKGLKPALVSRCAAATYELKRLSDEDIFGLICNLSINKLNIHKKQAEDYAELATLYSNGSPRDALGILERINGLTQNEAKQLLKDEVISVDNPTIIDLCRTLLFKRNSIQKSQQIAKILKSLEKEDSEKLRRAVLSYVVQSSLDPRNIKRQKYYADILMNFESSTFYSGFAGFVRMVYDSM